ncbi:hypothetical protein NDU88_010877 [Pleurodeles waltl]|uniref:Uncharacterized protein n=1 Tax=Pleurodeles waltl TaxID=8319 RepID=A0AAV7PXB5_PLEWA|nr:hypothetical protein NDU88_010877 [Pleurodeles waltl]
MPLVAVGWQTPPSPSGARSPRLVCRPGLRLPNPSLQPASPILSSAPCSSKCPPRGKRRPGADPNHLTRASAAPGLSVAVLLFFTLCGGLLLCWLEPWSFPSLDSPVWQLSVLR